VDVDCCTGNIYKLYGMVIILTRTPWLTEASAFISSVQTLSSISITIDELHTRQIPLEHDLLLSLCARRPDKECRPANNGGCIKVFEQLSGAVREPSKTHVGHVDI
jgi:hypothetical protein